MSAIERLNTRERDVLMQVNLAGLIDKTVLALDTEATVELAQQWDTLRPALEQIVQHAREDIFESRKRIARFARWRHE